MDSKSNNNGGIFPLLERMGLITRKNETDAQESEDITAESFSDTLAEAADGYDDYPGSGINLDGIPSLDEPEFSEKDVYSHIYDDGENSTEDSYEEKEEDKEEYQPHYVAQEREYAEPSPSYQPAERESRMSNEASHQRQDYVGREREMVDLDRFMNVEELYKSYFFELSGTDTIFVLEEYMKTLPDTLPAEVKKSILLKVVEASAFDFGALIQDGKNRIGELNNYVQDFSRRTESIVMQCNDEIAKMEEYINNLNKVITRRQNMHKKQMMTIENEVQRLKKIIGAVVD